MMIVSEISLSVGRTENDIRVSVHLKYTIFYMIETESISTGNLDYLFPSNDTFIQYGSTNKTLR